jgi:hypothetical protein
MAKKAATAVVEEVELDELDDDVTEEEGTGSTKSEVTFGVRDLADHLSQATGTTIKPKDLRTLIRKMAREDKPRVEREVVAGNRSRYDWPDGLKDPEVKAIIAAVTKGELEQGKKEALDALKARKAETKATTPAKGKKPKAKVEEPEELEEDEDELEDLELEEDDDE